MLEFLGPRNMDTTEQLKRVTIAVAIGSLLFVGPETPVALVALYPLLTGLVARCPMYRLLGMDTSDHYEETPAAQVTTLAPPATARPIEKAA